MTDAKPTPLVPEYQESVAEVLLGRYQKLHTFREAAAWCQQGQAEMQKARAAIDRLKDRLQALDHELIEEEADYKTLGFAARILGGRKERKALLAEKAQKEQSIQTIEGLIGRLEMSASLVPTSGEEQKEFLKILAQRKKELLQRKKEIAAGVKSSLGMGSYRPGQKGRKAVGFSAARGPTLPGRDRKSGAGAAVSQHRPDRLAHRVDGVSRA